MKKCINTIAILQGRDGNTLKELPSKNKHVKTVTCDSASVYLSNGFVEGTNGKQSDWKVYEQLLEPSVKEIGDNLSILPSIANIIAHPIFRKRLENKYELEMLELTYNKLNHIIICSKIYFAIRKEKFLFYL